ncbi:hypothetical protein Scep_019023 [Stephania cephalantha]|uniref:Uncharacterized protein n=1 Tax=Stephania cephalantha TaxID=152367 RepID=A0AAP0NMG0_9MAGN
MGGVGLFDKQAEVYLSARPKYPSEWFSLLSNLTPHHSLAWDVPGTLARATTKLLLVAEFYDQVIATDVSEPQISLSMPHPRVKYIHTPPSMSDDELIAMFGGEGMVDLVTVATACSALVRPPTLLLRIIRSWSAMSTAKEQAVDLLNEGVVKELETAWGGTDVIRTLNYKAFMLVAWQSAELIRSKV